MFAHWSDIIFHYIFLKFELNYESTTGLSKIAIDQFWHISFIYFSIFYWIKALNCWAAFLFFVSSQIYSNQINLFNITSLPWKLIIFYSLMLFQVCELSISRFSSAIWKKKYLFIKRSNKNLNYSLSRKS